MNKVKKIFFSIVSSVILAAIILPLLIMLLLYIPPVQSFVANTAAGIASRKIESTVSIGRLHLRPFNRLSLEEFYVEDLGQDTLLYADRVDVSFSILKMLNNGLSINSATLENPRLYMHQDADSTTNFRKILDKLKNPNPKNTKTRLEFNDLRVENMTFRFKKLDVRPREYGVNFDDIAVDNFYFDAKDILIIGDSIQLQINDASFVEKSGLELTSLSVDHAMVAGTGMSFANLKIITPESNANIEGLAMKCANWKSHGDFLNCVRVEGHIKETTIAFATIAYFAPSLRDWKSVVSDINADVSGFVSDMTGQVASAKVNEADLAFRFGIKGLPNIDSTVFDVNIEKFNAGADDIKLAITDVTGNELDPSLVEKLYNAGNISIKGQFKGTLKNFSTNAVIATSIGGADFDMKFSPAANQKTAFQGNVSINDINAGTILESKNLGGVSLSASVDGTFGQDQIDGRTTAKISNLQFNHYNYRNIAINGDFNNSYFKGTVGSNDPNIKFDFDGMVDFNDSVPRFDFDMQLFNADLHKLHLVERDSISVIRGRLIAQGSASSLDNFNGRVSIDGLEYVSPSDTIRPGLIILRGTNDDANKFVELRSDFADAQFRSRTSYGNMFSGLVKMLKGYIPTLDSRGVMTPVQNIVGADYNDYSLLSVTVKDADDIANLFAPGLIVAKNSTLSFLFNPAIEKFSMTVDSEYIEYKNNFASKLNIDTHNNTQDSLTLFLNAEDVYASGFYMPDFSILGGAKDNKLTTILRFKDDEKDRSALIGVDATFRREEETGMPQIFLRTTPSTFVNKGKIWGLYTRGIAIDSTKIDVGLTGITGDGQHLRIDGVASKNVEDTLHINLSNFDMNILTQFTENMGYQVEGRTSGHVDILSALKDGYLHANIYTDSMMVNDVAVPDMLFESSWDFHASMASFALSKKDKTHQYITGNYWPSERRYAADVDFEGLQMSLLDPILSGVIKDTKGEAGAKVKVAGIGNNLKINGDIDVSDFTTTVVFLNVPYHMTGAKVAMVNNKLSLPSAVVTDPEGNKADLSFNLNLASLANISYDLRVAPRKMMVLNTTEEDNDLFYGKVYASGNATIRGDKSGVNMDVTATTSDNSAFYMPLSDDVSSAGADVIRFIDPNRFRADSSDYLVRKRMIMSRGRSRSYRDDRSSMNISMVLNVLPNMDFQLLIDPKVGDILEGRGRGLLNLYINPKNNEFTMYGECEITEGSYQFTLQDIISKKFQIEQGGTIVWTGSPMDAELNVSAVYRLRASLAPLLGDAATQYGRRMVPVECRIMLTDKLSNPTVTFDVTLPSASPEIQMLAADAMSTQESMANQFLFLIAARTFYSDATGMSSIGTATGNTIAFEMLSTQIGNWLSNDKFNIGLGYKRNEEYASDEYNLDFSTQLFEDRLILEVEGNYDTGGERALQSGNRDASNLTGNFYLTWLIDEPGNLRAKAFSRTIDRFDDYGLQESGVGMYYREDFNKFSEVVRNFRNRFRWRSNKKKREALKQEEEQMKKEALEDLNANETQANSETLSEN